MLYNLLTPWVEHFALFNLFNYITFRSFGAVMTSLLLALVLGGRIIRLLHKHQKSGQPIRMDGPVTHLQAKQGTPTMGGFLILLSMAVSLFLWADILNPYIQASFVIMVGFALIGGWDDVLKLRHRSSKGLRGRTRLTWEWLLAWGALFWLSHHADASIGMSWSVPFFKDLSIHWGALGLPLTALCVVVGCANAVNLTDGLDGLAVVPAMIAFSCFFVIAWIVGNHVFASYLHLPYVPQTGELAVLCAAMLGAGLGFLWFNAPPAQIFMGDMGALAIGGLLGFVAVATHHELVLAIAGGIFLVETLSVMVQVLVFKITGRRVFLMAPLHHHFEKLGWQESTIVIRFWIIASVLSLFALATLKLR